LNIHSDAYKILDYKFTINPEIIPIYLFRIDSNIVKSSYFNKISAKMTTLNQQSANFEKNYKTSA